MRTRFVRYVMSDEFACGCCKRKPQDFAAVLTADMLDERPSMALEACTVRPVWITVDVPQDAAPGLYRTPVTVACDGDEQRLELAVEVTAARFPHPPSGDTTSICGSIPPPWRASRGRRCGATPISRRSAP